MSDEENAKLARIASDLAENTRQTGKIRALFEIHNEGHKRIDEKLENVVKEIWGESGLKAKAAQCDQNWAVRAERLKSSEKAGMNWQARLAIVSGWLVAIAAFVALFKK